MIAVDTSALMAIIMGEATADACIAALAMEPEVLISAATVAGRRDVGYRMGLMLDQLGFDVIPVTVTVTVTAAAARRVGMIYQQWGRGVHPAGLNFGDCFAYDVAREHDSSTGSLCGFDLFLRRW